MQKTDKRMFNRRYTKVKTAMAVLFVILTASLHSSAASERLELKTTEAMLTVEGKGILKIISTKGEIIQVNTPLSSLWKIVLNDHTGSEYTLTTGKNVRLSKANEVIRMEISSFSFENQSLPVHAEFTISVREDAFCFSGTVKSHTKEWKIKEVAYPVISGIKIMDKPVNIYWPSGLGRYFDSPEAFGSRSFEYPGLGGTMGWFSVNSPDAGLYFGCHDPLRGAKKFSLTYNNAALSFETNVSFPVNSNEFTVPGVMFKPYTGKWYSAARFYRGWYLKNFKIANVSDWARNCEGYMLTILKQQNGEVMYNYKDIDQLCDIAGKLNFKLMGLWGRGVGGHDRYYPNYMPDNLMGGREELRKAITKAHERGFKVIVYTNGKIIDISTDFYRYNGIEAILLNEKKQPKLEFWTKHQQSTPVIFAEACPGSALWRKTMMELAIDAQSLGADAFYIDQLSQISPYSDMCYSTFHDHSLPQEAFTKYRIQLVEDIRKKMKEKDPEFTIMSEGINDAMLGVVDMFQGVPGSTDSPGLFPEMFRYTFPEVIGITTNSDPGLDRWDANFSTCYGLRHEIMSRYPADADYLKYGKIPSRENYSNVTGPPEVDKFTKVSPKEITDYTHELFRFENENSGFFRSGKFIDEEGIDFSGTDILAKGFVNGYKIGVVVWNKNREEERDFSVSVPGYRLVKASEPENRNADAAAPLAANSLRLLIFEKN